MSILNIFMPVESEPAQYSVPKVDYQLTSIPEGPGVAQVEKILDLLPPLSLKHGPFLAGGAVRRLLQGRAVDDGDLDFFFTHIGEFKKFERIMNDYERVHASAQASTYLVDGIKVQLIRRRFYENLGFLFGDFDFTVCQVATDGKQIAYSNRAVEDINNMTLRFAEKGRVTKSTVVGRMLKYVRHGFTPEPGLFKMIVESGLSIARISNIFMSERPAANYDHDTCVDDAIDAKVFNSDALRQAALNLGMEIPNE